jgi:predicted amidohydrolase
MQVLAQHYHILTVAGSGITEIRGTLFNQSVVISVEGAILAEQPKMHLFAFEQDWGISAGDLVRQEGTPWNLYAIVCNDATYFESFRMVRHLGADLVAVPVADPEPNYSESKAMRGTWARVQETPVAGIVGAGTGSLFGFACTGKAGIYLPAELTPDGSGILAQSPTPLGEGLVSAVIDLETLHAFQQKTKIMPPGPWHTLYQEAP